MVHGLDLITAPPFVSTDNIKALPGDEVIRPGNTYAIEITPVNADGTMGVFFSRTYVITEDGHRNIVPYPMEEIAVAGG